MHELHEHEKSKGPFPSLRERPFDHHRAPLPSREEALCFALHRSHSSSLPNVNKSHRNKQKGQNEAEKELTVIGHDLIDDVNANVKWIVGAA
jgi:hypothetical protein